jgi:nitrogen fixation protein NifU and related proteins
MAVIQLAHDELETLHLCDGEGKTQEEAGKVMGISRGTVQRLLASARRKVAQALVGQKALAIAAQPSPDGKAEPARHASFDEHQRREGPPMSELYSKKVMDHVHNPRNVGSLEDANVVVQAGDPSCGDALVFFIKIADERVSDIKFLIKGCGAAIATSSMATELVMGATLEEVMAIDDQKIAAALDGLPEEKMHCSNMAATALHAAVQQYRATMAGEAAPITA